jgi:hypothetical protein
MMAPSPAPITPPDAAPIPVVSPGLVQAVIASNETPTIDNLTLDEVFFLVVCRIFLHALKCLNGADWTPVAEARRIFDTRWHFRELCYLLPRPGSHERLVQLSSKLPRQRREIRDVRLEEVSEA